MAMQSKTPHPVWTIARKELRESLRDGRFRVLAVGVLALLVAGLAAGWLDTREARQTIESARAADHATWLGQGARNPHSAAHFGHYAFKPRPVLSALDRGVDAYLGTAVWLEAHWQDPFALRPAEDRTALQRFGELSAAFTLQVLAPLLVIFLGFAGFAGERERGTLRQLASLGLEARTLAVSGINGTQMMRYRSEAMAPASCQRVLGVLALLALALHGAAELGHNHESVLTSDDCTICHVQSLSAEVWASPTHGIPAPTETRPAAETTAILAAGELSRAHPSRGPPV